jgi:hypothetical protein
VGKVVQPLHSVNCLDSHVHDHERHGPFTQLVGIWWFGSGWVTRSSWFGSLYVVGVKPMGIDLDLATGVTSVSLWPLVIVG